MPDKLKPTAKKIRGTGFYMPAVKTAFGPKVLTHGERCDTRYQAVKQAQSLIDFAADYKNA